MKLNLRQLLVLTGVLFIAANFPAPSDAATNRFSVSTRVGFHVSGKFKGIGNGLLTGSTPMPRLTPNGDSYNYDDGYLLTDISGNLGGQTWYVGYDDSASQIVGDQLLLSRSTVSANGAGSDLDADTSVGFELAYQRQLGFNEHLAWGFEAGINFQPVQFNNNGNYSATLTRVTDAYAFTPGTTPPGATPGSPYQGSYGGPGFLFGDSVAGTTTQTIPNGATFSGRHEFDGNLWGLQLGMYGERRLSRHWQAAVSGGMAVGLLNADVSWSETATLPGGGTTSLSASGSDSDILFGFYFGASVGYDLGKHWSTFGGVQYRFLGNYENNFAGREVEVNFSGSIFVTIGVSKTF